MRLSQFFALTIAVAASTAIAATRFPITVISGSTTGYVDTVLFDSGVSSLTITNLSTGERKATFSLSTGGTGTTNIWQLGGSGNVTSDVFNVSLGTGLSGALGDVGGVATLYLTNSVDHSSYITTLTNTTDNAGVVSGSGATWGVGTTVTASASSTLLVGLPPGAALVYGSTNDATLVGVSGANSYYDVLQFDDTTEQRARYSIPFAITTKWAGGAVTNNIYWTNLQTNGTGAVVWEASLIGVTNGVSIDQAYVVYGSVTNNLPSTKTNIVTSTIVFTPTNAPAGALWQYQLKRLTANAADTGLSNACVVGVSLIE